MFDSFYYIVYAMFTRLKLVVYMLIALLILGAIAGRITECMTHYGTLTCEGEAPTKRDY